MDQDGFDDGYLVATGGVRIAARHAGPASGPAVVLVAGWPQTLHAWRHVQRKLAALGVRSVALDPPGLGASDLLDDAAAYATPAVARLMCSAVQNEGLGPVALVGHDVGAWIAFAWAATRGESLSRLMLLDAAIPGAFPEGLFDVTRAAGLFQFFFNAVPQLPERLTHGRERVYLDWLFETKVRVHGAVTSSDIDVYMACYGQPERMAAGFDYYRAVPRSITQLEGTGRLRMPVVALGAEYGVGEALANALSDRCDDLVGGVVAGSGHFLPEEAPDALVGRIGDLLRRATAP